MAQRITIDYGVCNGCLKCIEACPVDVLRLNPETGKPLVRYPDDCQVCFFCQDDCPGHCLTVDPALPTGWFRSAYGERSPQELQWYVAVKTSPPPA